MLRRYSIPFRKSVVCLILLTLIGQLFVPFEVFAAGGGETYYNAAHLRQAIRDNGGNPPESPALLQYLNDNNYYNLDSVSQKLDFLNTLIRESCYSYNFLPFFHPSWTFDEKDAFCQRITQAVGAIIRAEQQYAWHLQAVPFVNFEEAKDLPNDAKQRINQRLARIKRLFARVLNDQIKPDEYKVKFHWELGNRQKFYELFPELVQYQGLRGWQPVELVYIEDNVAVVRAVMQAVVNQASQSITDFSIDALLFILLGGAVLTLSSGQEASLSRVVGRELADEVTGPPASTLAMHRFGSVRRRLLPLPPSPLPREVSFARSVLWQSGGRPIATGINITIDLAQMFARSRVPLRNQRQIAEKILDTILSIYQHPAIGRYMFSPYELQKFIKNIRVERGGSLFGTIASAQLRYYPHDLVHLSYNASIPERTFITISDLGARIIDSRFVDPVLWQYIITHEMAHAISYSHRVRISWSNLPFRRVIRGNTYAPLDEVITDFIALRLVQSRQTGGSRSILRVGDTGEKIFSALLRRRQGMGHSYYDAYDLATDDLMRAYTSNTQRVLDGFFYSSTAPGWSFYNWVNESLYQVALGRGSLRALHNYVDSWFLINR